MPKPLKKKPAAKKSTTPKRPSSDPNRRVHQQMAEHLARVEATAPRWSASAAKAVSEPPDVTPPHGDPFEAQYRARMAELGRKGGRVSGAKRMEMPARKRREIALVAARARWAKKSD